MRALLIADAFGIENLCWQERPSPLPGPGQVIVRITAVSFNFRDLQVIGGVRDVPRPLIPLSDACGVVSAIGEGEDAGSSVTASCLYSPLAGFPVRFRKWKRCRH